MTTRALICACGSVLCLLDAECNTHVHPHLRTQIGKSVILPVQSVSASFRRLLLESSAPETIINILTTDRQIICHWWKPTDPVVLLADFKCIGCVCAHVCVCVCVYEKGINSGKRLSLPSLEQTETNLIGKNVYTEREFFLYSV